MAYLDLKNAVIRLSPNQISATLAGEVVNAAYNRVIRARNWTSAHSYRLIGLRPPHTAGTVSTVRGNTTVVGVGTLWTGFDIHDNWMFQVTLPGQEVYEVSYSTPIRVASITNPTNLVLAHAWIEDQLSGASYALIDNRFSLGSNVERVISLTSKHHVLERKDISFINTADPNRQLRATPRFYAEFEVLNPGVSTMRREIEVWPVPNENMGLGLWFKALPPAMSADADIPSVPETLVEYSAQSEGCRILFGRTGDGNWIQLGQTYEELFKDALGAYMSEDMISQAEPPAPAMGAAA